MQVHAHTRTHQMCVDLPRIMFWRFLSDGYLTYFLKILIRRSHFQTLGGATHTHDRKEKHH